VYSFGVVFYNSLGLPSDVYWIADIKMPDNRTYNYMGFREAFALGVEFEINPDFFEKYTEIRY
jgi:hypothetical protein